MFAFQTSILLFKLYFYKILIVSTVKFDQQYSYVLEYTDPSISVALGYVAHVLIMCASFLQVPLRYSIVYMGSRSHIIDHIAPALADRDREFPLYTKGKDRIQFNYAVYLLNKNLAQLRLLCGQHTPDLRATLSNLLSFLQGRDIQDIGPSLVSKLEKLSLKLRQDEMQRNSKVSNM